VDATAPEIAQVAPAKPGIVLEGKRAIALAALGKREIVLGVLGKREIVLEAPDKRATGPAPAICEIRAMAVVGVSPMRSKASAAVLKHALKATVVLRAAAAADRA
jgi:hypothetical protein